MTNSISALRSEVIEKTINIEWLIHVIISQHYFGRVRIDFVSEVLYDEQCPFALKRRIVLKLCPGLQGETEQQLNRINTIRNFFAHVGQSIVDGPNADGPSRIPSPRDFSKSVDFEAMHKEFLLLEGHLVTALFAVYEEKGGVCVKRGT